MSPRPPKEPGRSRPKLDICKPEMPHRGRHGKFDRELAEILLLLTGGQEAGFTEIQKALRSITRKLEATLATIQEVKEELASLKEDVETEHGQVNTALGKLADKIAELEAIIAAPGGATNAELDEVLTGLKEVHADIKGIIPDEAPPE